MTTGRSDVQEYAKKVRRKVGNEEKLEIAIFKICKQACRANSKKNGTSSIKHHLREVCEASPFYVKRDKNRSVLTSVSLGVGLVPHVLNPKRLEQTVVIFVIIDEQPFRVVEGSGYMKMMKEAFKLPNRRKNAAGVWDLYISEKSQLIEVLCNQRVSITTDT